MSVEEDEEDEEVSLKRNRFAIGAKMNCRRFLLRGTSTLVMASLILFAGGGDGGGEVERDPRSPLEMHVSSDDILNSKNNNNNNNKTHLIYSTLAVFREICSTAYLGNNLFIKHICPHSKILVPYIM